MDAIIAMLTAHLHELRYARLMFGELPGEWETNRLLLRLAILRKEENAKIV